MTHHLPGPDRWEGYTKAELTARRNRSRRAFTLLTIFLAGIAGAIMLFNAGVGTPFLIRIGVPAETAWLAPFIADAALCVALVGTWYVHADGGRTGWLMVLMWVSAALSWVLTAGGFLFLTYGPHPQVAVFVLSFFPAVLIASAHGAAQVQRHEAALMDAMDGALRTAPRKAPQQPLDESPREEPAAPVRAPVRSVSRDRSRGRTKRPTREAVVAELAEEIRRTGQSWQPDYGALMDRTGYGRSWCEKTVSEAREDAGRPRLVERSEAAQ